VLPAVLGERSKVPFDRRLIRLPWLAPDEHRLVDHAVSLSATDQSTCLAKALMLRSSVAISRRVAIASAV
jgi:hypothetical protein